MRKNIYIYIIFFFLFIVLMYSVLINIVKKKLKVFFVNVFFNYKIFLYYKVNVNDILVID